MRLRSLFLALVSLLLSLAACGAEPDAPPAPTLSPEAALGQRVFTANCASCHSLVGDAVIVGPSLADIAERAGQRVPDQDAATYILTSIVKPDAYIVDGFQNVMPSNLARKLTGEELDGLVAFLLTR